MKNAKEVGKKSSNRRCYKNNIENGLLTYTNTYMLLTELILSQYFTYTVIYIISSAARGSGTGFEHPLLYLQTHPPCLSILD